MPANKSLSNTASPSSAAELLLLSRFHRPDEIAQLGGFSLWAMGCHPLPYANHFTTLPPLVCLQKGTNTHNILG